MTLLETRQPDFPEHPEDGFQIKENLEDGYIIWTYSEQFNQWTYELFRNALEGFIYTDQVRTRSEDVPAAKGAGDEPVLFTQRDVNHYLNEKEVEIDTESFATKAELAELQSQVDNLSGLLIQARYEQGTGITTRPGEFVITANDTQQNRLSQGTELKLYETDIDGKTPALTRVIIGDTIHIADPYGASASMQVTHTVGTVIRYSNVIGTLDRISDRVPYSFRISGQA